MPCSEEPGSQPRPAMQGLCGGGGPGDELEFLTARVLGT